MEEVLTPPKIETPTSGFSPGLTRLGELISPALAAKSTKTPETPTAAVPPPVQPKPTETPPAASVTPPTTTNPTEPVKPSVPEFAAKHTADWQAAKDEAYKRGLREAEERLSKSISEKYIPKEKHDELVKERDELRKRIQTVAVERDPEFRRPFEQRIGVAVEMAKRAVDADKQAEVERVLKSPPSEAREEALNRLFENMNPAKAARLTGAITQFEQAMGEYQSALTNAEATARSIEERNSRAAQEREQIFTQGFEQEWGKAVEAVEVLKDEKISGPIKQRAEYILRGAQPVEVARSAVWAALAPDLANQVIERDTRIASLQAELDQLRGKKPSAVDGGTPAVSSTPEYTPGRGAAMIAESLRRAGHLQ